MTEQRRDDRVMDAAVDAAWREAAQEQPPTEVDAAILAAAHAAARGDAQKRKAARGPRRWASWQPLAAAAGVIGLSFLLVQMLPRERLAHPPTNQGARQPATESAVAVAPEPSAGAAQPARVEEPASPPAAPPPAAVRPSALPPAAPAASATSDANSIMSEEREATAGVAPRAAMEAAAKQSVGAEPESPAAWASRIVALHDAGDLAAAAAELSAFRAAEADADRHLPEPLRAWAASVPRDGTP
jgi:hypothetical protein